MPPGGGLLPCTLRDRGCCVYRRAYECQDEDRALGLQLGHCTIEHAKANALLTDVARGVEWLPENRRAEFMAACRVWVASVVYLHRARAWQAELWNRGEDAFSPAGRIAERYVDAGRNRMLRAIRTLRPMQEEIRVLRVACASAKAMAAAMRLLEAEHPERLRPKVLDLTAGTKAATG
jgi:hypothetical protein